MIPLQTVYLRKKNEELLNDLEDNARLLSRRVEICSKLLRGRPHYCAEDFTEHHCPSTKMSPIAKFNRRDRAQPVKILHSSNRHRSLSAGRVSSSSADRVRSPRRGHSSCVPSEPIGHGSSTEPTSRWSKFQQDLASNAHMHGYTLSHALSKCYCTRKDGSDTRTNFAGSSRIFAESFRGKSRIPPRLKEKRHLARSPKRRPGNVKWAVPNETPDRLTEDIYNIRLPIEDYEQENNQKHSDSFYESSQGDSAQGDTPVRTRCVPSDEPTSEHDSDWFLKMKNFRKSNWSDCHAPDRQDTVKLDCKCNSLFRVGERLFLEPIQTSMLNKDCCCSKPRERVPTPSSHDTVVTLPKVRSEVVEKSKERTVSTGRTGRISGTYNISGPCFLTGHKTRKDEDNDQVRAFVLQRPPDSFALRYQKGVNPRRF